MDTLTTWFAMGGHAAYIWPAYGLAALLLGASLALAWRAMRRSEHDLATAEAARPKPRTSPRRDPSDSRTESVP
jgi:heme exporter protein D